MQIVTDVLAGYDLHGDDAIDATRALRSTLHGFVTLEIGGAFRLPVDIDRSFDRLIEGLVAALQWTEDESQRSRATSSPASTPSDAPRSVRGPV